MAIKKNFQLIVIGIAVALVITLLVPLGVIYGAGNVSVVRDYPASADSSISEKYPSNNYGDDASLQVRRQTNNLWYFIVYFDISEIPAGSSITSANLSLYLSSGSGNRDYGVHRVTSDWEEDTVTWNSHSNAYVGTATDVINTSSGETNTWDVTGDVSTFVNGTDNYGWVIKDESSVGNVSSSWASREASSNQPALTITFSAPWDSHTDGDRSAPPEDSYAYPNTTAYMGGSGFVSGNYSVAYYDGVGTGGGNHIIAADDNINVDGSGILQSEYLLSTDPEAVAGTWHALVQPASGYAAFPSDYDTAVAGADTYGILANDSFNVEESAIPEFPTFLTAVAVLGISVAIYFSMRKRVVHAKA